MGLENLARVNRLDAGMGFQIMVLEAQPLDSRQIRPKVRKEQRGRLHDAAELVACAQSRLGVERRQEAPAAPGVGLQQPVFDQPGQGCLLDRRLGKVALGELALAN